MRCEVTSKHDRRSFIGGSDARVIMGDDEAALRRLWQEKRGEIEPEDLSGKRLGSDCRTQGHQLRRRRVELRTRQRRRCRAQFRAWPTDAQQTHAEDGTGELV